MHKSPKTLGISQVIKTIKMSIIKESPFNHTRVYVNEVTFRNLLRMGAGCQGNKILD